MGHSLEGGALGANGWEPEYGLGPRPPGIGLLLGASERIERLRRRVLQVARSPARTILVQGETGTGKELVARAIHAESPRAERELVVVNCSAVPDHLLEAEFLGYEAGAFTDARQRKPGLFELADGGTLFLDEVSELAAGLQSKLLRLFEDPAVRPLGATRSRVVDVRVVAATNVDLAEAVSGGSFRSDLYYRLNVVALTTPPLRERRADVEVLARHFLELYALRFHKRFEDFAPEALALLEAHDWPGNVRELKNAIERVVLLEDGPRVESESLLLDRAAAPARLAPTAARPRLRDGGMPELELDALVQALERAEGNRSQAAKILRVSRDTVRLWMRKHGVRIETRVTVDRAAAPGE